MEDIKIGEYARCGSIGIAKVCSIEEMPNLQDKGKFQFIDEQGHRIAFKYIQKHHKHILRLIEAGDIVNDRLLTSEDIFDGKVLRPRGGKAHDDKFVPLKENEIKSIVTHEQIERDKYYVKK